MTTSSRVALKADIRPCGSSDTNPTVSDKIVFCPQGNLSVRIVGSSVAKSWSATLTDDPVRRLNNVDLPALV